MTVVMKREYGSAVAVLRDEIDNGELMIRSACPADYEPLQVMHRTLSLDSRVHRWFAPLSSIPRAYLLDAVSGRPEHLALVAATSGGTPELAALASAVRTTGREWELGILVADRFQHRGLGRRLLVSLAAELPAQPQQYLAADGLSDHRELLLRSLASVTEISRVDESLGVVRVIGAVRARQPQARAHRHAGPSPAGEGPHQPVGSRALPARNRRQRLGGHAAEGRVLAKQRTYRGDLVSIELGRTIGSAEERVA
jgi:hypothetical protein